MNSNQPPSLITIPQSPEGAGTLPGLSSLSEGSKIQRVFSLFFIHAITGNPIQRRMRFHCFPELITHWKLIWFRAKETKKAQMHAHTNTNKNKDKQNPTQRPLFGCMLLLLISSCKLALASAQLMCFTSNTLSMQLTILYYTGDFWATFSNSKNLKSEITCHRHQLRNYRVQR